MLCLQLALVSQKGPHTNKTSACLCVLKSIDHAIQIHTYILYIQSNI